MRELEEFGRGLEESRRRMREPTPRNRALAKILGPKTREGIAEARRVIREWIEEHPEHRLEFRRYGADLFRNEHMLLQEEERRRGWGPREWERERIVEQASGAGTLEEIARAQEIIRAWLEQHPEDAGEFEDAKDDLEVRAEDKLERIEDERDEDRDRNGLTDPSRSPEVEG